MSKQTSVGTAYFRVNGVQYALAGECKLMTLKRKRNALVGLDGNVAPQIEFQSPMVECSVRDRASIDLQALADMEDATVTIEMANGTMWELSEAFYTGEGELEVKEGAYQVRFNGSSIRRIA